jgi:hypothetical protein
MLRTTTANPLLLQLPVYNLTITIRHDADECNTCMRWIDWVLV